MVSQSMNKPYRARRESGVVLIVGLVFLLLMTLVGVTAIQSSTTQERMAGNASDRAEVFQSAENVLQAGEVEVIDSECTALESLLADLPDPDALGSWTGTRTTGVDSDLVSDFQGAYVLTRIPARLEDDESAAAEETETCGGFYYVTARAASAKGMAVVLRSTVFKRY